MTTHHLEWSPFLAHQLRFFDWQPPPEVSHTVESLLGGWGSGKTEGAARRFLRLCAENGWREEYGQAQPIALVAAPTLRILRQATMDTLEKVIPRAAILRKRGAPHYEWILVNGVKILFTSGESQMEGVSAFLVWIDEVQHEAFSSHPTKFLNYMARIRDAKAQRRAMIVSGIPESGWVREHFDKPDDPAFNTILCATEDNHHIPRETLERYLAQCPSGYQEALLKGQWMAPPEAIYSQYDARLHLTDDRGTPDAATHIGIDVGNAGAVIFAQEELVPMRGITGKMEGQTKGLIVVDELLASNLSVDEMCYRIKTEKPWRIVAGRSVIHTDPNTDRDELAAMRRHFPGVTIIRRERGDETYSVDTGIRRVQTALRDALGNVRLRFWRGLLGTQYGALDGLQRYRRNPNTGQPVKDNLRDHMLDALRMVVAEQVPVENAPKARVIKR